MPPLVSVIISTKNEAFHIQTLLESLRRQTIPHLEIIVIDNFSSDATRKIARNFTRKIYTKGHERSSQRNYGATIAQGEYLLFLDADMELPSDLIAVCINRIEKTAAKGLIIPEDVKPTNFFTKVKRLEKRIYWGEPEIEAPRLFLKSAFWKAGGYNKQLIAGEDWDLSVRIKKIGFVDRISLPLFHDEHSFKRELQHKKYYAAEIRAYAHLHPEAFLHQSGWNRISLFWRKRKLLIKYPLETLGLFSLMLVYYFTYLTTPAHKKSI